MTTWSGARKAIKDRLHGVKIPSTWEIGYSSENAGPFVEGELLTFQSGGTGTLVDLTDNGTTGTMFVRMSLSAVTPVAGNMITGGTSGASAIVAILGTGTKEETLTAFEYGPGGRQGPKVFPFAWIVKESEAVSRLPGWRESVIASSVRVALAPRGAADDVNELMRRSDEWVRALTVVWDEVASLGGAADISVEQEFGGLALYEDVDRYWGFDMSLPNLRVSEPAEFKA